MHQFGFTLTTVGELLIGYSVIRVHWGIKKEHKIDKFIISEIGHEIWLAGLGMVLIVTGFFLQIA